jgi:hypothetical protein
MEKLTRRLFLRKTAALGVVGSATAIVAVQASQTVEDDDDGPLLADDVTGTTDFADWHERKYGFRPENT